MHHPDQLLEPGHPVPDEVRGQHRVMADLRGRGRERLGGPFEGRAVSLPSQKRLQRLGVGRSLEEPLHQRIPKVIEPFPADHRDRDADRLPFPASDEIGLGANQK